MPPQIRRAGEGTKPVVTQAPVGVEEAKSTDVEKKSVEQQKDTPKNGDAIPYQASAKEASNKKGELNAGAASQRTKLDQELKLKEKAKNATTTVKQDQRKSNVKQSEGSVWESVKGAAQIAAGAANAGARMVGASAALVAAPYVAEIKAEKDAAIARHEASVKKTKKGNEISAEVERVGSSKGNFVDAERVIGKLDTFRSETTLYATGIYDKDKSMHKLLGPYGYDTVTAWNGGQSQDRAMSQDEILDTALHNWRNTPVEARKAIHEGNYGAIVGTDYQKNWRPLPNVHGQNRAEAGQQIVMNPPLKGDHGRVYVGPRANQPDPDLVWANAKKDFTQASFDLINSLGGELPAKAPGSPGTVVNSKRSSTSGRPNIIDTSRSAPPPQRNVAETPPGPIQSSNVPKTTSSIPTQQQTQTAKTGQEGVAKNNIAYEKHASKSNQDINVANKQVSPEKKAKTQIQEGLTAKHSEVQERRIRQQRRTEEAIGNLHQDDLDILRDALRDEGVLDRPGPDGRVRAEGPKARVHRGGKHYPKDWRRILGDMRDAIERSTDPKVRESLESNPQGRIVLEELGKLRDARLQEEIDNPRSQPDYPKK